jgi:hypothetical protein
VFLPLLLASGVAVMHAAPIVFLHLVWVLVANLVLIGLSVSACIQVVIGRFRATSA